VFRTAATMKPALAVRPKSIGRYAP
jgi:hypothetical protein